MSRSAVTREQGIRPQGQQPVCAPTESAITSVEEQCAAQDSREAGGHQDKTEAGADMSWINPIARRPTISEAAQGIVMAIRYPAGGWALIQYREHEADQAITMLGEYMRRTETRWCIASELFPEEAP